MKERFIQNNFSKVKECFIAFRGISEHYRFTLEEQKKFLACSSKI